LESDWRWNVSYIGLSGTGAQLAARLVPAGLHNQWLVKEDESFYARYFYDPSSESIAERITGTRRPIPAGEPFPYGWPVESD